MIPQRPSPPLLSLLVAATLIVHGEAPKPGEATAAKPAKALASPIGLSTEDWAYSRGDSAMRGLSPTRLQFPLKLLWQKQLTEKPKGQAEMLLSSAVVRSGKVYLGAKDGGFHCLQLADGLPLWSHRAQGAFDGSAALAGNLVVAGCQDGFVYAWNADSGKLAWKFETQAEIHASANVWTDGKTSELRILIGSYDYKVYCLNAADGKKIWEAETGYYINGGVAIDEDKVVFGGCDSVLHVHDASSGRELRQIEVGAYIGNNVAISDGVVYVSHYGNRVAAYSINDGAKIWEYGEREFEFYAAPTVGLNRILCGGRDKRFHAIDRRSGSRLWEFRCRDRIDSSAVLCGAHSAVFGSDDGHLYALDIDQGEELWQYEIGAPIKSSPAVAGGRVLVGADDGILYCFGSPATADKTK